MDSFNKMRCLAGSVPRASLLVIILASALISPAGAAAASQRYASPSGSGTACTSAFPCAIRQAITAAGSGAQVIVKPGVYALTATLSDPAPITIQGVAGQPRPRLQFSGAAQFGLRLTEGSILRYVEIDQGAAAPALFTDPARIDQVIARGSGGYAPTANIQDSTIRNSIVVAAGPNATALSTDTNGGTSTSTYRNVTAVATGSNGIAIGVNALGVNGDATIDLVNVIAWSAPGGSALKARTDSSGAHATIHTIHSNYATKWSTGTHATITSGGGDQGSAPLFVNAGAGNYHEAAGSPTINAGVNDPLNGPYDVDGNPRLIGTTDIGADEFVPIKP